MSDLTFTAPERRSLALPIVFCLAMLGAGTAVALHFLPAQSPTLTAIHTDLLPTSTAYKTESIVLGPAQKVNQIFVASTVRIDNKGKVPIYLDDFTCTFVDQTGAELKVTAYQKNDLPNIETSFPALRPLLQTPLLRESRIDPNQPLQGTILLAFPFTAQQWNARKTATIQVALYHQPPLFLNITAP